MFKYQERGHGEQESNDKREDSRSATTPTKTSATGRPPFPPPLPPPTCHRVRPPIPESRPRTHHYERSTRFGVLAVSREQRGCTSLVPPSPPPTLDPPPDSLAVLTISSISFVVRASYYLTFFSQRFKLAAKPTFDHRVHDLLESDSAGHSSWEIQQLSHSLVFHRGEQRVVKSEVANQVVSGRNPSKRFPSHWVTFRRSGPRIQSSILNDISTCSRAIVHRGSPSSLSSIALPYLEISAHVLGHSWNRFNLHGRSHVELCVLKIKSQ